MPSTKTSRLRSALWTASPPSCAAACQSVAELPPQVADPRGSLRRSTPITCGSDLNWVAIAFQSASHADCGYAELYQRLFPSLVEQHHSALLLWSSRITISPAFARSCTTCSKMVRACSPVNCGLAVTRLPDTIGLDCHIWFDHGSRMPLKPIDAISLMMVPIGWYFRPPTT